MSVLTPVPYYLLGILTYHVYRQFRKEANRGAGGEIERIIKLKDYSSDNIQRRPAPGETSIPYRLPPTADIIKAFKESFAKRREG